MNHQSKALGRFTLLVAVLLFIYPIFDSIDQTIREWNEPVRVLDHIDENGIPVSKELFGQEKNKHMILRVLEDILLGTVEIIIPTIILLCIGVGFLKIGGHSYAMILFGWITMLITFFTMLYQGLENFHLTDPSYEMYLVLPTISILVLVLFIYTLLKWRKSRKLA